MRCVAVNRNGQYAYLADNPWSPVKDVKWTADINQADVLLRQTWARLLRMVPYTIYAATVSRTVTLNEPVTAREMAMLAPSPDPEEHW